MKEIDNEHTPQWFVEALESANVADSVRTRMRDAGQTAYAMARMRAERENVGFVPLPFAEYLEGLATMAGVRLEPVLAALNITSPKRPTVAAANRIGKLAHALGFHLDELIVNLRVAIAEEAAGAPLPMLAAHRGASAPTSPAECASILDQLQPRWPPELRAEMEAIRTATVAAYRECAAEEFEVVR